VTKGLVIAAPSLINCAHLWLLQIKEAYGTRQNRNIIAISRIVSKKLDKFKKIVFRQTSRSWKKEKPREKSPQNRKKRKAVFKIVFVCKIYNYEKQTSSFST